MNFLNFVGKIHDITLSFFKILIYLIYGYLIYFLGEKYWGYKESIKIDDPKNIENLPKINRDYWYLYENLRYSDKSINENIYSLTYFPFLLLFFYILIKFSLFDIFKLILTKV